MPLIEESKAEIRQNDNLQSCVKEFKNQPEKRENHNMSYA